MKKKSKKYNINIKRFYNIFDNYFDKCDVEKIAKDICII